MTYKWEDNDNFRVSLRSKRCQSYIKLSSPGVLHQEDEISEHVMKASGAYSQETQRAMGNRDSTAKGYTQNLTHSGPRAETVI